MRRPFLLLLCLAGCGLLPTLPNGSQTGIRVSPRTATIVVGQTQRLTATTTDSAGDSTGVASVTWTSTAPSVAPVSSPGVALGVAPGVSTVVAKTSAGASDSAVITVVAATCDVAHLAHVHGHATVTYHYAATLGSVQYVSKDSATMTFTADSAGSLGPGSRLWMGSATGTGALHDQRTDLQTTQVQTITGRGALVVSDINLSHVIVNVDVSTCKYTLEGVPYIDVSESPSPGDLGPSFIGGFRTIPTPLDTATQTLTLATHSADWTTSNYLTANGWYYPSGFSTDYFSEGAPDDGSAGTAVVTFSVDRGP